MSLLTWPTFAGLYGRTNPQATSRHIPSLDQIDSPYFALTKAKLTEYWDILTYLLTPRSRVLLEKLTVFQLVKKFPALYGTENFITAFKSAHHLSLF